MQQVIMNSKAQIAARRSSRLTKAVRPCRCIPASPSNDDPKTYSPSSVCKPVKRATFVLGGLRAEGEQPEMDLLRQRFLETAQFWKTWISKSNYKGRWREMVHRSALVLKLLISRKHGSLIAAPTFSLPESIGGVRNWDYRYTWLRDAAFTLYALIRLGFLDETEAFFDWVKGRLGEDAQRGPLQVMYGVDGRQKTGRDFARSSVWV